jgi:hypothetical protein
MRDQKDVKCLEKILLPSFLCSILPPETSDYRILILPAQDYILGGKSPLALYQERKKQTDFILEPGFSLGELV